jgi:hypothetical protein
LWNFEGLGNCSRSSDEDFLNFVVNFDIININILTYFNLILCQIWQKVNDVYEIDGYECISVPRPKA